jgi:Ca2+-binding RTX toxin-like protein
MADRLTLLGTNLTDIFGQGAAEIVAFDPNIDNLFIVNGARLAIDLVNITDPTNPTKLGTIDLSPYGGGVNSVAVKNGIVAVAVEANDKQNPGQVVLFDTNGNFLNAFTVGALPDMLTFTPDGTKVLIANEGEPNADYTVDPEGSVSIIDLTNGTVTTADFRAFNAQIDSLRAAGVRIFGPGATVAQDLEPEYITVSADSRTAWITLQENNAIAVLDLTTNQITQILPLGYKDFNAPGNGFDASDRDNAINIQNWPVLGMYQPDAIASYTVGGETYLVTANEGDARAYSGFNEEVRVGSLNLDPTAFPNAADLKSNAKLGRLRATNALGDTDGDGDYDRLYAYGGRSFSIWKYDSTGNLVQVFDSGDDFEQIIAQVNPTYFNANNNNNIRDDRSDDKGPEPEAITLGQVNGRTYAFIGMERDSGIFVYDITSPTAPTFVQYINNRDFTQAVQLPDGSSNPLAGDLGPEGITFISAEDSPIGRPLLLAASEISGTTSIYDFGSNVIEGTPGNNDIKGTNANDLIRAGAGDDKIDGGNGNDVIFGGDGKDGLQGSDDNDVIYGNAGEDKIDGGNQSDTLYGGEGNDDLKGGNQDDRLYGDAGNDKIAGGNNNDILYGGQGNDNLKGENNDDILVGVQPNISLAGVGEIDTLTGNTNSDRFVLGDASQVYYNDRNATTQGLGDYALITDLNSSEDKIQLKGSAADYQLEASPSGLPIGTAIFLKNANDPKELIAIVQGSNNLNLTNSTFSFV